MNHLKTGTYTVTVLELSKQLCMSYVRMYALHTQYMQYNRDLSHSTTQYNRLHVGIHVGVLQTHTLLSANVNFNLNMRTTLALAPQSPLNMTAKQQKEEPVIHLKVTSSHAT